MKMRASQAILTCVVARMLVARILVACMLLACMLASCGNDGSSPPPVCNTAVEPAVRLALRDAATQQPIVGAVVTLSEGTAFSEVMLDSGDGNYRGGLERPGTYLVEITATGYLPQVIGDVVAPATPCGPETQRLDVDLQPGASPAVLLIEGRDGDWQVQPVRVLTR